MKVRTTEVEHILFELADENKRRQIANAISPLIGENFDDAPVWDASTVTSVSDLYAIVRAQFIELNADGAIPTGYERVAESIDTVVTKSLQTAVRKRLT